MLSAVPVDPECVPLQLQVLDTAFLDTLCRDGVTKGTDPPCPPEIDSSIYVNQHLQFQLFSFVPPPHQSLITSYINITFGLLIMQKHQMDGHLIKVNISKYAQLLIAFKFHDAQVV